MSKANAGTGLLPGWHNECCESKDEQSTWPVAAPQAAQVAQIPEQVHAWPAFALTEGNLESTLRIVLCSTFRVGGRNGL